jgi:expansin (peptidoglycan-binding protein)
MAYLFSRLQWSIGTVLPAHEGYSGIMRIAASIIFIAETEHEMYSHVWISGAAVFCLLCGCSEKPADASRPPAIIACSDPVIVHTGDATYYVEASGAGNCCFDSTPNDLMIGAMNHADYNGSYACGTCVEVTGPDSVIDIRIVDQCPECLPGDIDLSPLAFSRIAAIELGRVPISWHIIPCGVSGPIIYHFKDGSNEWWTAVQIRNHRYPISHVEYRTGAGEWLDVPRTDYNYFVKSDGMGPGPYAFRVTDLYGHTLIDSGVVHLENADVPGGAQFPECP